MLQLVCYVTWPMVQCSTSTLLHDLCLKCSCLPTIQSRLFFLGCVSVFSVGMCLSVGVCMCLCDRMSVCICVFKTVLIRNCKFIL